MSDQESHRSVSDQGRTGQQARGDYSAAGRRFGPPDQDAPRDEVPTQNLVEADPRAPAIPTLGQDLHLQLSGPLARCGP